MKRTDVTYGQLDRVLRALGFSRRQAQGEPPAWVYDHKETGASFIIPSFPESDLVLDYHLVGVRTHLDQNGIADPKAFDAKLQKAG